MKKLLFFFLIFLLILPVVYSVGIGPPRVTIDFEPGLERNFNFMVVNTIDEEIEVSFYAKGELAEYVTLDKDNIRLLPGQQGDLKVTLKLPDSFDEPGIHEARIGALETPVSGFGGTVGAKAGVEAQLQVKVPYEGKFISAGLEVTNVKIGELIRAVITVTNLGDEDVDFLKADVVIVDDSGQEVALGNSEAVSLRAKESKELVVEITSDDLNPGIYKTEAVINYDGAIKKLEKEFNIGDVLVEILDLVENEFKVGEIVKLEFNVQNKWNEVLDTYAKINIYDGDKLVDSLESKSYSLEPWKITSIESFWEAEGVGAGNYKLEIILHYQNKTSTKQFDIELVKSGNMWWIMLVVAAVVLVAVLVGGFVWKRKKQLELPLE